MLGDGHRDCDLLIASVQRQAYVGGRECRLPDPSVGVYGALRPSRPRQSDYPLVTRLNARPSQVWLSFKIVILLPISTQSSLATVIRSSARHSPSTRSRMTMLKVSSGESVPQPT